MDFQAIARAAKRQEKDMVAFLRDIVAIPSESGRESEVVARIRAEMERAGVFNRVWTDGLGNLLATIGSGPRLIAIDAHIDTVGVGSRDEWKHDPYKGKVAGGFVYGRGAGDQKGAVPPMIAAARILHDLGLHRDAPWTLLLACTVMEEDCDGLCWQYLVREEKIRPECVIVTDSTNCRILRGQRGRMEIGVRVRGRSCHGSMPHKGINAVYLISRIVREIEALNERLPADPFLGKGTVTVSHIECKSPSLCAVPGEAYIHLDRRLTAGETKTQALREVRDAARRAGVRAEVFVPRYEQAAWTGRVYPTEKYYPTWVAEENAPQVRAAVKAHRGLFGHAHKPGRWVFSTNAVAIAGMFGIPCVGFGPAEESVAHTVEDRVPIEHLTRCAAFYAAFPGTYCGQPAARAPQGGRSSARAGK